jgi:O-antigen ligase
MGGAALVSGSRGGMVALLASLIVMVALGFHAGSRRWTLAGLALGLLLIVLSGLWIGGEVVSETTERLADEVEVYESSPRVSLWTDALGLWSSARLVGTGLDTFASAFGAARTIQGPRVYTHAESDLVQLLTDTGAVGLGLGSAGVLALSLALVRTRRYARSSTVRAAALGALVGLLGTILQGVANFNLAVMSNLLYVTASVTIVLAGEGARFHTAVEPGRPRTSG